MLFFFFSLSCSSIYATFLPPYEKLCLFNVRTLEVKQKKKGGNGKCRRLSFPPNLKQPRRGKKISPFFAARFFFSSRAERFASGPCKLQCKRRREGGREGEEEVSLRSDTTTHSSRKNEKERDGSPKDIFIMRNFVSRGEGVCTLA